MSLARRQLQQWSCTLCRGSIPFSTSAGALEPAPSTSSASSSASASQLQKPRFSKPSTSSRPTPYASQPRSTAEEQRKASVAALKELLSDVSSEGPARGSQIQNVLDRKIAIDTGMARPATMYQGKPLRPGDLNWRRMFPSNLPGPYKSTLNTTTLGPTRKEAQKTDFYLRSGNINPLAEPLHPNLHARFVTNMGKIMNRAQTGLTWKNQKRMGKAVRRARAMGIVPYFADWSSPETKREKEGAFGMWKTDE